MLKKWLFLLVLIPSLAQAGGIIAEGKTDKGAVALTDDFCLYMPGTKVAYHYKDSGDTLLGCWARDESRVFIAWDNRTLTSYSFNFFNVKEMK